ncbi:MAG TPA: 50S ribosomal protein L25, partial [Thermoanaerobaculia bacterium]
NNAGRLRRGGRIPGVVYGGSSREGEPVSVDPKALLQILHSDSGANTLITLKIDGAGDARVLVKEYQLDPITHKLLHADFYRVAMDKLLRVTVPVHLAGDAKGVKAQGGVLEFVNRDIEIECLPADIPAHIAVDVNALGIGDAIRVSELAAIKGVTIVDNPEKVVVHVTHPTREEEPAAAAAEGVAAEPAEPEVLKKGKAVAEEEAPAEGEKEKKKEKEKEK